jgi:hypothetical protein
MNVEKAIALSLAVERLEGMAFAFDPSQPRDKNGMWTEDTGGGSGGGVGRFAQGKRLTKEQKKEVLKSLSDVYKENKLEKVVKGYDHNGDEIMGYPYAPELFETSSVTGAKIRHYIILPDGKKAHPTELFPNMKQSDVDAAIAEREYEEKMEKRNREDKLRRVSSVDKGDANRLYSKTGRKLYKSYFAKNKDGKIVRVSGNDPKDVEFWKAEGYEQDGPENTDPNS